ncbi:MAG TPA: DUF1194 domain-containing protein [Dongiaceae bacterium]|jgi:hypothetical protein
MHFRDFWLVLALAAGAVLPRGAAAADLALVLLTDVSSSMGDEEFKLVKEGYRNAFADPEVIDAIAKNGSGVAIAYVEFSDESNVIMVKGWNLLTDGASSLAFGEAVAAAPRSSTGNTALSNGIGQAAKLLLGGNFGDARLVIDVASDHPGDGGQSSTIRDRVLQAGITINALPIMTDVRSASFDGRTTFAYSQWGVGGIVGFYRENVIGGPGSFLVEAADYPAFGEALKRKLLLELVAGSELQDASVAPGAPTIPTVLQSAAIE